MRKIFAFLLLLLAGVLPCRAQVQKLPSAVAQEIISSSAGLAKVPKEARKARALANKVAFWQKQTDLSSIDMALGNYFLPNPKVASTAQLQENQKLQLQMVRHWLEKEYAAFKHSANLTHSVRASLAVDKINYLELIPSQSRLVLLGEAHGHGWIAGEIFSVIEQMRRAYPGRRIYYASEFIYANDENPGAVLKSPDEVARFSLSTPFYRELNERLFHTGVRMVGLEHPDNGLKQKLQREEMSFWQSDRSWNILSPEGVRERNRYWTEIIHGIYEQDPQALVLVHAGSGHTSYRQLYSLPRLLQRYEPFVVEFSFIKNTYAPSEKHLAVSAPLLEQARRTAVKNPGKSVYFVQVQEGKRAAWLTGSNLLIRPLPANTEGR